jgi:hypothetical protein
VRTRRTEAGQVAIDLNRQSGCPVVLSSLCPYLFLRFALSLVRALARLDIAVAVVFEVKKPYFIDCEDPFRIEDAIEKLPTGQLLLVAAWLDDYRTMIQSSERLFEQLDGEGGELAGCITLT